MPRKPDPITVPGDKPMTDAQVASFWGRVDMSGDCWPWTGTADRFGYGSFSWTRRPAMYRDRAHRLAYRLTYGDLPPSPLVIMHACDNPACCNPAHLSAGTQRQNLNDAWNRGRLHQPPGGSGADSPTAKLSAVMILEACRRHALGETWTSIAKDFGVYRSTLSKAGRGVSWKCLSGTEDEPDRVAAAARADHARVREIQREKSQFVHECLERRA